MSGGPCSAHAAPRVYVASPIFTEEQLRAVGDVVRALEECGYVTYSPSRDGVMLKPDDPAEKRDEVFFSNINAIDQSDLLVALLDVKDTGTTWELGAATGRRLSIIAVTLDVPTMNVMLERGVIAHVRSLEGLKHAATLMRPFLLFGRKSTNELADERVAVLAYLKSRYSYSGHTQ